MQGQQRGRKHQQIARQSDSHQWTVRTNQWDNAHKVHSFEQLTPALYNATYPNSKPTPKLFW